jgi:hypothetical protein
MVVWPGSMPVVLDMGRSRACMCARHWVVHATVVSIRKHVKRTWVLQAAEQGLTSRYVIAFRSEEFRFRNRMGGC